eukprot:SAG31_NODE_1290_length_8981_cov_2.829543_5_plen_271_part_00
MDGRWLASIKAEHTDVEAAEWQQRPWGASRKYWTTKNYNLRTCPAQEYCWVATGEWAGKKAHFAPGGTHEVEGNQTCEDPRLARQAVPLDELCAKAPTWAFEMLKHEAQHGSLSFDMDQPAFEARFLELRINTAEILSVRLYTGPMHELYNMVLRAAPSGGLVLDKSADGLPADYPRGCGDTDGHTAGKFVTSIHSVNSCILKLSKMTPITTVFRGVSGRNMPQKLLFPDEFGSKLGVSVKRTFSLLFVPCAATRVGLKLYFRGRLNSVS